MFHYCIGRKLNLILELGNSNARPINLKFVAHTILMLILSATLLPNIS